MRARIAVTCSVVLLVAGALTGAGLLHHSRGPLLPAVTPLHESASATLAPRAHSGPETLPDGFVLRRLKEGERPPQFVLVSFDGAGWADMWDFWFGVAQRVPFRFTAFLSGTYLLSDRTATAYHPPYYAPGTSQIFWYSPADLPVEISHLNRALAEGDEIGTHFNGHFCSGAGLPSGGNTWTTADWDTELTQFFTFVRDYRRINHLPASEHLDLTPADVHGARTPCLEGVPSRLYPALRQHGLTFDSSFTHPGLEWPRRRGGVGDRHDHVAGARDVARRSLGRSGHDDGLQLLLHPARRLGRRPLPRRLRAGPRSGARHLS